MNAARNSLLAVLVMFSSCQERSLHSNVPKKIELSAEDRISAIGDSLTYGQDVTRSGVGAPINGATQTRSPTPYPESLETALRHQVHVDNLGFPGDQLRDGIERWKGHTAGAATIVMFGGNDALNNGHRPGGIVRVGDFERELYSYVWSARKGGSNVVLLVTPPFASWVTDMRVEPYRFAVRRIGAEAGVPVIETAQLLKGIQHPWTDGVHLTPAAYKAIGDGLSSFFVVRPSRKSPPQK